jgi:riboflavin kinase / FMN adenylyltransferase
MLISHDYRVARLTAPTALAIGNFDGVHRGHRYLFQRVIAAARSFGGQSLAVTFDPHPTHVLAPDRAAPQLMGVDRRVELMAAEGLDAVVVQRFDTALSSQPAREFVEQIVMGLRAREVFIGHDFHFGRNREGTGALLQSLGAELGFVAHVVEPITEGALAISSTRVRKALADGDLPLVRTLLGRRFDVDGMVIQGHQRGRTLGFPTANLAMPSEAVPRDGVYAVRAEVLGDSHVALYGGVANLGTRPTFRAGRSIEAHLFDTDRDLYGRTLRLTFIARIRDERRFDSIDALRTQIQHDAHDARAALTKEAYDDPQHSL